MKVIKLSLSQAVASINNEVTKNSYFKCLDAKGTYLSGMKVVNFNLLKDYNEHGGEIPMHVVIGANALNISFEAGEGDNKTFIAKEVRQVGARWVAGKTALTLSYLGKAALKLEDGGAIFEKIAEIVPSTKEELASLQGDSSSEGAKKKASIYAAFLAKKEGEENE